jgi:MFS family permease
MASAGKSEEWQPGRLRRVVLASMIGTTIEWYDFFLYGSAAALVFNKLFFPSYDPFVGTLLAFATYAVGFVARPLGGIVFGHFGDRIGRKRLLMLSLVLMGVATVLIGLLPTYARIGLWAPAGLIVLRLVQGFAVGGEWGGAVLMAAEHGDSARRGFWASWPQAGVAAGSLLSAGVLALMAAIQSERTSSPGAGACRSCSRRCWWRRLVYPQPGRGEPDVQEGARRSGGAAQAPRHGRLRERPGAIVLGAGLRVGENISYYILTVFSLTFLVDVAAESRGLALEALLIGAAVQFFAIPLFAALSDRIGRRPVYAFGGLGLAAFSFAFFPMLASGDPVLIVLALVAGLSCTAPCTARRPPSSPSCSRPGSAIRACRSPIS